MKSAIVNNKTDYLQKSFEAFRAKYGEGTHIGTFGDSVGTYAMMIERKGYSYYFCAKNSQWDETVSIHADLVGKAYREQRPILLWLKGKCFLLKANNLLDNRPWANVHNNAVMLNFTLAEVDAIDVDTLVAHQSTRSENPESSHDQLPDTPTGRALAQLGAERAQNNGAV